MNTHAYFNPENWTIYHVNNDAKIVYDALYPYIAKVYLMFTGGIEKIPEQVYFLNHVPELLRVTLVNKIEKQFVKENKNDLIQFSVNSETKFVQDEPRRDIVSIMVGMKESDTIYFNNKKEEEE